MGFFNEKYIPHAVIKITTSFAELVGILLGDGSLNYYTKKTNHQKRLKITFHSDHTQYQLYVYALVHEVLGQEPYLVKRTGERTVDLLLFHKASVESLLFAGLVNSPKWERAVIPQSLMKKEFAPSLLRGYFDTDGSVVITNNNGVLYPRLEMKISPSPMQKQLLLLLEMLGFKYGCYSIGKGKVRVQMNGCDTLRKWEYDIGFSNTYYSDKVRAFWRAKHNSKANKIIKLS